MSESTSLRRKLFLAGKAAQPVEKSGHNHDGDFEYAKAEDVLAEASRVLEEQEIVILPSVESAEFKMGKTGVLATASMEFEVCDTVSGETLVKKWSGTGFDFPGDKALFAAQTGCEKYFLAKLLNIPFGIDPEDDSASPEAKRIAAEQDQAAEQPDTPPTDPVPAEGSEVDGLAADTTGLDS